MKAPLQQKTIGETTQKFGLPELIGAAVLALILASIFYALIKSKCTCFSEAQSEFFDVRTGRSYNLLEVKDMRDLNLLLAVIAIVLVLFQTVPTNRPPVSNRHWIGLKDADLAVFVFTAALAAIVAAMAVSL
ncbi:hypothetical protein [Phyllobacterium zundukense]|uniref:Uncharacterized protein n=1 Tax=Phyllobacterium zundukense TaxID=1867719 RepID=A0ACD4CXC0_9HYPH|nr:hypothetical protein [Phyllobacterium zundukense]UXN58209.1 hypothetical protein N8E88_05160 [Phyllobacterium zundukense]